jgi:hypothetical protein
MAWSLHSVVLAYDNASEPMTRRGKNAESKVLLEIEASHCRGFRHFSPLSLPYRLNLV